MLLVLIALSGTWLISTDFWKILKYQISWKSVQWETSCSIRKDGRTDKRTDKHAKANSRFSQFCERTWKNTGFYLKLKIFYTSYTSVEYYDFCMVYDRYRMSLCFACNHTSAEFVVCDNHIFKIDTYSSVPMLQSGFNNTLGSDNILSTSRAFPPAACKMNIL